MHSQFRLVFFLLVLFVLNAGHAIDRLQPINKMNARIQCTAFYVCECCCYAIVSQLTKYGSTHSVSARSFISFHSCLQREIFLDLVHILYFECQATCVVRHDSDATLRSDYIRWTYFFSCVFVSAFAGWRSMLNISSVKCVCFVDQKAKHTHIMCSLPTRPSRRRLA